MTIKSHKLLSSAWRFASRSIFFFLGQPGRVLVRTGEALMASLHGRPCRVSLLDFFCVYENFAFLIIPRLLRYG